MGKNLIASLFISNYDEGRIYLQAPTATKSNLYCKLYLGTYMTVRSSHPFFSEIYSNILTALAAKSKLTFRIKNWSNICEVSYVRIYSDLFCEKTENLLIYFKFII